MKTFNKFILSAMFLLVSSHICFAGKSIAAMLVDLEWSWLQNTSDVREVLSAPPEASGMPCWDQNLGTRVFITSLLARRLDDLPDMRERLYEQKGSANDLLKLAAAWNARGCPFMSRQTYLDVIESFPDPIFEAYRLRAHIGLDDIQVTTHGAMLEFGPKRTAFGPPMRFKQLRH